MQRARTRLILLVIAGILLLASGCAHRHQLTWKHETIDQMRATLAEEIPPGTPLATAQAFMEREGFECALETNERFVEREHWADDGEMHEGLNYLRCYRTNKAGHWLVGRVWTVALVHYQTSVTDVLISMYVDGP